jgi:hypothetical protein
MRKSAWHICSEAEENEFQIMSAEEMVMVIAGLL